jgi:hypothetical protein
MQHAAAATGGQYYELDPDEDIVECVREALGEMRARYLLRYVPIGTVSGGGTRLK